MIALLLFPLLSLSDDSILVTATRGRAEESNSPFFSESVAGEEWENRGMRVESALSSVPGLSFSSAGGPGQTRSVFVRGARSEDTLVLFDGIVLNDPLSPSRSFDFSRVPGGEIDRIEISKGPQSVMYGSDAMGGVVQIFSRNPGPPRFRLDGGSYGTIRGRASAHGFQGGYESSEGFSAADTAQGNQEKDGHRAWNLGGKKDFSLGENTNLRMQGLYFDAKTDTDRSGGPGGDSTGTYSRDSQLLFRTEALKVFKDNSEWSAAGSLHTVARDDNTNGPSWFRARLWKVETNASRPMGKHIPLLGAEFQAEAGRSSQIQGRRSFRNGALYAQDHYASGPWHAVGGGRLDLHSEHGKSGTFRMGTGYWLIPETLRVKTSFGSGFKAPSLYQTYSTYGTPGLRPSKILSGDLGLEYSGEDWTAEGAFFGSWYRDLIDFDTSLSRYFNIGRARIVGWEAALGRSIGFFSLKGAVTGLRATDRVSRLELLRRPRYSGSLEFAFRKGDFVGAALRSRYAGKRQDIHPVSYTRQTMPSFFTLGLDLFHRLASDWKIHLRGENLLNRRYQETSGFGTPGRSFYLGLEAEL